MADLGSVGYASPPLAGYRAGTNISGTVTGGDGLPASRPVFLLNRPASASAAFAKVDGVDSSPSHGGYSFVISVANAATEYVVVAFDDASGTQYNAKIYDKVVGA